MAIALAGVGAASFRVIVRGPLPRTQGTLPVAGIHSPVRIARDEHGIPRVAAENDEDCAFAAGFVHGQDRLWQMELLRRIAAGRLAEILGRRALPVDRLFRRLGIRRVAEAEWHVTHAGGDVRRLLLAYAAGVNAAARDRPVPAEVRVLRYRPEPWTPEDSLATWRLRGLSSFAGELLEGLEGAGELLRAAFWLRGGTVAIETSTVATALRAELFDAGSLPGPWYLIEADRGVTGLTLPGLPFVFAGSNGSIAWAPMPAGAQLHRFTEARFNPNNPLQFDDQGTWLDAVRFSEVINVRGHEPVKEDVIVTSHGPVIGPALAGPRPTLCLRWLGLDSEVDSAGWMQRLNLCRDWRAFRAAIGACPWPALRMVYCDAAQGAGWRQAGFMLETTPEDAGATYARGGYVAFADMPEARPGSLSPGDELSGGDLPPREANRGENELAGRRHTLGTLFPALGRLFQRGGGRGSRVPPWQTSVLAAAGRIGSGAVGQAGGPMSPVGSGSDVRAFPGQSGHPGSPHYADLTGRGGVPGPDERSGAVGRREPATLTLEPLPGAAGRESL